MTTPKQNDATPASGELKGNWIEEGGDFDATGHYYGLQMPGIGKKTPLKDVIVSFTRFLIRDGFAMGCEEAWPEGHLVPAIVTYKDGRHVKVRKDPDNPQRIRLAIGPGGKGIIWSGIRVSGTGVIRDVFFQSAAANPADVRAPDRPTIFISYSHKDEGYRERLCVSLESLVQEGVVVVWHDREMRGGEYFEKVITVKMKESAIILLLASPDFIASNWCADKEVPLALRLHESGKSVCMPIILRECDWKKKPYAPLVCNPKDGKAIAKWRHRDDAYQFILENIRGKLAEIEAGK